MAASHARVALGRSPKRAKISPTTIKANVPIAGEARCHARQSESWIPTSKKAGHYSRLIKFRFHWHRPRTSEKRGMLRASTPKLMIGTSRRRCKPPILKRSIGNSRELWSKSRTVGFGSRSPRTEMAIQGSPSGEIARGLRRWRNASPSLKTFTDEAWPSFPIRHVRTLGRVAECPRIDEYCTRDSARFDGVGKLTRVVSQRPNAPRFALVNNANEVVSFVSPAPGVNLQSYEGQQVVVRSTWIHAGAQEATYHCEYVAHWN